MNVENAAACVYRIVTANLAEAIRDVTVKRGTDPRDFALVAFGGAGGQHAAAVAHEMDMKGAIFPRSASTFSAFGLLTADLKNSLAKSLMVPLRLASPEAVEADFNDLAGRARQFLEEFETSVERVYADRWAVRYAMWRGESHEWPFRSTRNAWILTRSTPTSNGCTTAFTARNSATRPRL